MPGTVIRFETNTMHKDSTNPIHLFLPLFGHADDGVRRQAGLILLGTFGMRALTYLRRSLEDSDRELQNQARKALDSIAEIIDIDLVVQPHRSMYVECLGGMRVYIDNHEIQPDEWMQSGGGRAGGRKVRDVFAYLVHCGRRGATRKDLAMMVWGAAERAGNLARTLSTLRQILVQAGGNDFTRRALLIEGDRCALSPEVYLADVQLFEQTFDLASKTEDIQGLNVAIPLYRQVLQLYGGSYMADVAWGTDWPQERRERLVSNFVIAAERLAEHAYTRRLDHECITFCRQALDVDATADDITTWLLRAYARLGMWTELERAFRRYLRVTKLDVQAKESQSDAAIRKYYELTKSRERNG